jgi:heme oxygenase (mycobilin-producing)
VNRFDWMIWEFVLIFPWTARLDRAAGKDSYDKGHVNEAGSSVDRALQRENLKHSGEVRTGSFLALSKFRVANGLAAEVRAAFVDRPRLVDGTPGFFRMEVVSPIEAPEEFWLLTWWTDEVSFRAWHRSHLYRDSHAGIPRGLKLDPAATEIRYFEQISD